MLTWSQRQHARSWRQREAAFSRRLKSTTFPALPMQQCQGMNIAPVHNQTAEWRWIPPCGLAGFKHQAQESSLSLLHLLFIVSSCKEIGLVGFFHQWFCKQSLQWTGLDRAPPQAGSLAPCTEALQTSQAEEEDRTQRWIPREEDTSDLRFASGTFRISTSRERRIVRPVQFQTTGTHLIRLLPLHPRRELIPNNFWRLQSYLLLNPKLLPEGYGMAFHVWGTPYQGASGKLKKSNFILFQRE